MKKTIFSLLGIVLLVALPACSIPIGTPTTVPTQITVPSLTPLLASPTPATPTISLPTASPEAPTAATGSVPTATTGGITPGTPSGPYGVILVVTGDVLNIRTGPGAGYSISGTFPATATNVMRTGPSTTVADGALWVQVQNPAGGSGWVNANYLTEYIPGSTFCADSRVQTLISNFGNALATSNGTNLANLVSPAHGMAVRLWRGSEPVIFDREHALWVFESEYEHNWGAAPGSGLDTIGAFHLVVLPKYLDVFNAPAPGYTLSCNVVQTGGASYDTSWPAIYANINFYSLYKPGPAGNELSWRTLLIGVEYVLGQPYVFSVTQMDWEP